MIKLFTPLRPNPETSCSIKGAITESKDGLDYLRQYASTFSYASLAPLRPKGELGLLSVENSNFNSASNSNSAFLHLCLILCFVLSSCGPSYAYEEEHRVDDSGWAYDTPLAYDFSVSDTNQLYNLHLILDHATTFGTQNTYVLIRTIFPDGNQLEEEVSLQLADKFGQWFGDCGSENCTLDIPIQQGAFFNVTGDYRIEIEQFSRESTLQGVNAVGFALEEVGRKS